MSDDAPADGLEEVLARRFLTTDAAREQKVTRRHQQGRRTARENIADLVDPGSLVEYGRFATAAQERRRDLADLVQQTPADGLVGGIARVDGRPVGVLSYDYLVLAGTQGLRGHHKTDRLLETIGRLGVPAVFFAEGGGGRPDDTDYPVVSALDVSSFALWGRLAGVVPRIAVVAGRCFAGNAVIAGSADLVVACEGSNLGMAGPAMVAGAGLGEVTPEQIGPLADQTANGVVDVAVTDEPEAVAVTRELLGLLTGSTAEPPRGEDQTALRQALPANDREAFDAREIVETLCDTGSVVWLREEYAPELVTCLARLDGRPVGVLANQSTDEAGALTAPASRKAARFLRLCDSWGLPVVSLVDTPGFLVGPETERTGLVREAGDLVVAGSGLSVPLVGVVLRRGYGLGAQAMLGGSTHAPLLTLAWPGAHLGPMGLEGAVRLAGAKELSEMDEATREETVRARTAEYRRQADALNAARVLEVDDVIDPAETRELVVAALRAAGR